MKVNKSTQNHLVSVVFNKKRLFSRASLFFSKNDFNIVYTYPNCGILWNVILHLMVETPALDSSTNLIKGSMTKAILFQGVALLDYS